MVVEELLICIELYNVGVIGLIKPHGLVMCEVLLLTVECVFHVCVCVCVCVCVISTGPQTIKKAQGENVTLGCTYVQSPSDTGQLDVEWSNVSPDMTQKDRLILSYSGGTVYKLGDPGLMSRLKCVGDPGQGDASIFISPLQASDTATYECKVKKPPGIDSRKVTLVVLVRPSVPKCWVDNGEEIGSTIILRCKSSEGTSPLKYNWIRESGGSLPPTATQSKLTGELLIQNHSQSYTGSYLCEVTNEVGKEQCKYSLRAYSSANKAGVIAGAVIGALLLLLLLLLLIWLLICCCQKHFSSFHPIKYQLNLLERQ
uniref:Ig-like domain-containing protein n=1 Tax=Electrophorus electricus TaxID=8005 RepID=A0A4W4FIK5_ELEEL